MSNLHTEIKQMIIDTLDLENIEIEEIIDDQPLFVDGLGLDSIDALEIGLALQKNYGIKIKSESEYTREHFSNVNNLVVLVESQRTN